MGTKSPHDASRHLMIRVMSEDRVIAGDPLTDGPLDPLEVLSIMGERAAQKLWSTPLELNSRCNPSPPKQGTLKSSFLK